jgi:hypothetical protein
METPSMVDSDKDNFKHNHSSTKQQSQMVPCLSTVWIKAATLPEERLAVGVCSNFQMI